MATFIHLLDEMADLIDSAVNNGNGEFPVQVSGRRLFAPSPPTVDMWPGNGGEIRDSASAGFQDVNGSILFTVRARVAAADHEAEQELLYSFCDDEDDRSIYIALMDDQTLNGYATSVKVTGPTEPTIYQDVPSQTPLLGVQWRIEVIEAFS